MSAPLLYVTGTNTGVGKTTLACALLRRARARELKIAALKPFCSGGREDAQALHSLQTAGLSLDEVNPYHFEEPVAPYVAARNQKRAVTTAQALELIDKTSARGFPVLIEGAGGLMSPLGEQFTLLDIIRERPGRVCVVGSNVLGVINSALLTHAALESNGCHDVRFVLMASAEEDVSARSNASVIREWTKAPSFDFPFFDGVDEGNATVVSVLDSILSWWLPE